MPAPETKIIALLSESPKRYKELKRIVVDEERLCSNQTLSSVLKRLKKEEKITKELRPDRSTIYKLAPSYVKKGNSASDIVTLEGLIGQLDSVFREESLTEIKPLEGKSRARPWWEEFAEKIHAGGFECKPKLRFSFYLDNSTKGKADLFLRTGEISAELRDTVASMLRKIRERLPLSSDRGYWEIELSSWDDSKNFAKWLASAYGMQAAVLAFYDGKDYREIVTKSLKRLNRLQSGHEQDIQFLNEIAARCKVANKIYYNPDAWLSFYDEIVPDLRYLKDIYSRLDEALWWYSFVSDELRKPSFETALISSAVSDLRKNAKEISVANLEETHPYTILDFDAYFKMKALTLTDKDKNKILKFMLLSALAEVKSPEEFNQGKDWTICPDEYIANITRLASRIEEADVRIGEKGIPQLPKLENDPVLNFKFGDNGSILDFSDEPIVIKFKEYLNMPEKRNWLQKCLDIGLPLLTSLPLKELGFRVRWII